MLDRDQSSNREAPPDDEIAYESGGMGFRLMGVLTICALLWLGLFMFSLKKATVAAAAFGAVGAAWVYYREGIVAPRRRTEAMREAAAALGLAVEAKLPPRQFERLKLLPPFNAGQKHAASNVSSGSCQGVPFYLFDSYYQIPGAKAAANYWQTVVFIPEAGGTPDFYLAPRHFFDNVAHLLGFQDIALAKDAPGERFARYYRLRGPEEQAVRVAFDGRPVEYLADRPGWTVSCSGGSMAVWRTAPTAAEASSSFKLTGMIDPHFRYVVPAAIGQLLSRAVAIRGLFAAEMAGSSPA